MKDDIQFISKVFSESNLGKPQRIEKFSSGQVNNVYNIDDTYVLKIEGKLEFAKKSFRPQPELMDALAVRGVKVPKILTQGKIEDKEYLLMEKIKGSNLIHDWLKFTLEKKENIISQIARQLRLIHSIKFSEYKIPIYKEESFLNLEKAIRNRINFSLINRSSLKREYLEIVDYLENFYENNKHLLNETDTAVLVHNDMHWENIMYQGDEITGIIDWDWVSAAPRDYELWRIVVFCYNPRDYMEEGLEPAYRKCPMGDVIVYLKKYYPELFFHPNLVTRIRLFLLDHLVNVVVDYQSGRWREKALVDLVGKVDDLYKSDRMERMLGQ